MSDELELLEYKLKSIDCTLKELKELLVDVPILGNNLDHLKERVEQCETNIENLTAEVNKLKNEPMRKSAEKWKYITDFMFKSVVAIIIGILIHKVGLV